MALLVYVTMPGEQAALALAQELVERGLAAGVNVLPGVQSVYRWRGEVCRACECLLLAQVADAAFEDVSAAVCRAHSYEVPCITAMPLTVGHTPFMEWIARNSRPTQPKPDKTVA